MRVWNLKISIAVFVGFLCAMILTACGGGADAPVAPNPEPDALTLEQYYQNVASATEASSQKVDALDAQPDSFGPNPSDIEVITAFRESMQLTGDILGDFGDALRSNTPPPEIESEHERYATAYESFEASIRAIATRLESVTTPEQLFALIDETGEGLSSMSDEVLVSCLALQDAADNNEIEIDLMCVESADEPSTAQTQPPSPPPGELPGIRIPDAGRAHVQDGDAHPGYSSVPATSGAHYSAPLAPAPWAAYNVELPPEVYVHNLEHGGVGIFYDCPSGCDELVGQLKGLTNSLIGDGYKVMLAPHDGLNARISLAAWTFLDSFEDFDEARIQRFVDAHESSANSPEPFVR